MKLIIYLLVFTLLLTAFIIYSLDRFGKHYMKLLKEYEMEYNYLKFFLDNCKKDLDSLHELRRLFSDINKYSCRNKEQISVLKYQYVNKFIDLIKQQTHELNEEDEKDN